MVNIPGHGRILEQKKIYEGRVVGLQVDHLEKDGHPTVREVVRHPGGVVLLGQRDDGSIPFVRQFRYPIGRDLLELPAGKLDPGEDPASAAVREMEEETGYRAEKIAHVFSFYSTPGFCDELLHLFYSPSLSKTAQNPEFDEELEVVFHTLEEAMVLCRNGSIQDAKTLVALLWKSQSDSA